MPHWLIKSAIQRAISFLPKSNWWNELLQKKITKSVELTPERFELRLRDARRHLDELFAFSPRPAGQFSALELGTGWFPIVPIAFYLCGATEVWTVDIVSHLTSERIKRTFEVFAEYDQMGKLGRILPRLIPERVAKMKAALGSSAEDAGKDILETLGIHALVRDAQKTGIAPGSVDLFTSNSVLQYIPRQVLANMLSEFKRIARPGAILNHFIVLSDEYAEFDHSISKFNFLKYSDSRWRFLDSPFTRKPRLRISDFREIFAQSGCEIVREEDKNGSPGDMEKIRLAPRFQGYSKADLLVIETWIAARFTSSSTT